MDHMGELAVQLSHIGHQTQWRGRGHLSTRQIGEAGLPALALPLYSSDGHSWAYVRRPPVRGGRVSTPGRRQSHGPDVRKRYRVLSSRVAREYGEDLTGRGHLLQSVWGQNQLAQIFRDMGQQQRKGVGMGPGGQSPMDPEGKGNKISGYPDRLPPPPGS
jgi:hypothetical protein